MKKLKLTLEDLEVSSFAVQKEREDAGTVKGMDMTIEGWSGCYWCYSFVETQCAGLNNCTGVEGCYPSMYCSDIGPGMPNASCGEGCMTDNYANC